MVYHIRSTSSYRGAGRTLVYVDDVVLDPRDSQRLWNHSPDGFAWGYGGSGPAQLALAILQHTHGDTVALRYHQAFKAAVVARWSQSQAIDALVDVEAFLAPRIAAFTCPRCGLTSYNPHDQREGYCGRCHDWTDVGLRRCRLCGCTNRDCRQCIAKTGAPCWWVADDLCSACAP